MIAAQRLVATGLMLLAVASADGIAQDGQPGRGAPDFSFTSRGGEHITLDAFKGGTVVLDFCGSWCRPCVTSTPGLVALHEKYARQGVAFVGIAAKDKEDRWGRFIDGHMMDWPQYLDRKLTID